MGKGIVIPLPENAPLVGEVFKHYKEGDLYKVVGMAIHAGGAYSDKDEWLVVYEPMYENAAAPMFARPITEWLDMVEWEGRTVARFSKI